MHGVSETRIQDNLDDHPLLLRYNFCRFDLCVSGDLVSSGRGHSGIEIPLIIRAERVLLQ